FLAGDPVPVDEALSANYTPVQPGYRWGAPWSTTWFRVSGQVPAQWSGTNVEATIDIGFSDRGPGFQAEGLAFTPDGTPVKAVQPRNNWVPVSTGDPGGAWSCFVEAVAMPSFMSRRGLSESALLGDRATMGTEPLYTLGGADLVVVDEDALGLTLDVEVLLGVMEQLAPTDPRRHEILRALERCVDTFDEDGDTQLAREVLKEVMAAPAARTAHRISAVGHAHIDSAWLWPVNETIRKCARTFSNVAALGERYPDLVFACSQAQQWWWMKEKYPAVFERMKEQVKSGQIVPVGGMWVESDTNVTGAESLVRQLVFGKKFFLSELGVETEEVWLPDCFGYSPALPQLILLSGSRWFLTQKISWNDTNKFPHHTFWWEGIDGSRVFTHFPPVDTYNADMSPLELARAARNYAEQGFATRSLVPFGYGDGGGGPTREMMELARRQADLDGSPRVVVEAPSRFFSAAQSEYPDAPVWSGELYLELHRGTLTSQVEIKQGNRRSENLLREAELWSTAAMVAGRSPYPYDELEEIWRDVLLNQFHDILPGSSIAMVNDDAIASYARITARAEGIVNRAIGALGARGDEKPGTPGTSGAEDAPVAFNAAPHGQGGVPAFGARKMTVPSTPVTVAGGAGAGGAILDNGVMRVQLDTDGHIVSLLDLASGREVIPPGLVGNVLQLHPDVPNNWPAWDIDRFYRHTHRDIGASAPLTIVKKGPDEATARVEYAFGSSRAVQTLTLAAGSRVLEVDMELDWREHDRLLKMALPVDVHAGRSTSEIQFGHVERPTHTNTSWDVARFEYVAHRFIQVEEAGFGVAVVNRGIYGHEVTAFGKPGGGRGTMVRLTIIRGPRFPDHRADNGTHRFHYGIVPGASVADAVRHGYQFNLPLRTVSSGQELSPLVQLDNEAVVVEAVKAADDRSGDVVLRCYESLGGRAASTLQANFPVREVWVTDLLERPLTELEVGPDNTVAVQLRPFQVLTLRLSR
ncbi:MAG TPA: glycoside hydrolase family 38 C-terminal domain-containing protein, partial [Acidimicrobiales bacterium]|nr:glycoside hydrolase family 38 C-terminal domain-containing protein [Acidimicrobiales bacterium]